ncbi:hypothetical protein HMPREF1210_00731 [Paenisporosarcina sp. HGH0030]|uniref:DUF6526 family protein n=1 Tax=Paenisporosarcina sp. HGH0030 TaxID=1078085 RepID=UPI00034E44DA|nr:DUF6526 family protein [Paenisporosarcina sp. HGH0030]EPD53908.1 hypothetical protein HMPREF1210_00731 [Paenisporosarcina sp. HGH0030]
MENQNYKTHVKVDPLYHYVLSLLLVATLVVSIINVVRSFNAGENILQSILLLLMVVCIIIVAILVRMSPLKNQDRTIRAEENLRHFVLTGKLLDSNLSNGQIIALRFAGEQEFPTLCERAVNENLSPDDIKKAIVSWKADHNRI